MAVHPERGGKPTKIDWSGHYTRWVALLNTHPDISMDFVGLADQHTFEFLDDYDFIFLYIHPKDREGVYWWYEIPEQVRKTYKGKVILQLDYEGFMYDLPPMIKKMIDENADVFVYNSPVVEERWKLNVPKYPLLMIQSVEDLEKLVIPLPKSMRGGIGIMWHAGTLSNVNHNIALCLNKNWRMKVFTAWSGMTQETLYDICSSFIGSHANKLSCLRCHGWMEYEDFLKELSKCYVVLEDNENYYGVSRLSYECASLKIPVVGSTNNYYCKIAYPYTTTNPLNVQFQTHLIKRLFEDQEFYDKVVDYAYSTTKDYFSNAKLLNTFVDILKVLGLL